MNWASDIEAIQDFSSNYCESQRGKSKLVLCLVGFCLLAKRSLLDKIGGFDERFEYGSFENDDLCLRAVKIGYQLQIVIETHLRFIAPQTVQSLFPTHLFEITSRT